MKVLISAGELSGDEHGAPLVAALRRLSPQLEIKGMGGRNLARAGIELLVDAERAGSVMGFSELLGKISSVWQAFGTMRRALAEWKPDALVIINYSDFNLALAKRAKKLSIPVLFYIPPQVWAWRSGRVETMKKVVDKLALIFPFEKKFYQDRGVTSAVYVGHPLTESMAARKLSKAERDAFVVEELKLDPARPIALFFPGSRRKEIAVHLLPMVRGFAQLRVKRPEVQGVIGLASENYRDYIYTLLRDANIDSAGISIVQTDSLKLLQTADAGIIKSGTSNLQAAYCGLPFSMLYVASAFSAFLVRRFVSLKSFSIVNILRPGTITELLQDRANPDNVAAELERLLFDQGERDKMSRAFYEIRESLSGADTLPTFADCGSPSERTARLVQLLKKP